MAIFSLLNTIILFNNPFINYQLLKNYDKI